MTFVEMHVKWSVILADRLGPEILTMLEIKGQVLHRVHVHLKVPGWLSDLKALLTRKLPMFLSRLNEISGGREKMCLVSGSVRRFVVPLVYLPACTTNLPTLITIYYISSLIHNT